MISGMNTRELILGILLAVNEEGEPSHRVIREVLTKHQFLPKPVSYTHLTLPTIA